MAGCGGAGRISSDVSRGMERPSIEKLAFVLSLAVLAFLFGFAASKRGWFPHDYLVRAWDQARVVLSVSDETPPYLDDRVYDRTGVRISAHERVQPGLTLVSSNWESFDWLPGVKLIDRQGRIVHEWRIDPTQIFPGSFAGLSDRMHFNPVHGSHLLPNGDVLVSITGTGTARLDACGRVLWKLPRKTHHSITPAGDGTYWISGKRTEDVAVDSAESLDESVFYDRLLHVSGDGEILQEIVVFDLLRGQDVLLRRLMRHQALKDGPTHLNDVEPLPDSLAAEYPLFEAGDLLVSLRNLHLVLVADPETRRVLWHASRPFILQHDPDFIGDGWIGVFDNHRDYTPRGARLGGSRIMALRPHMDSTRVLFPTGRSAPFYTDFRGKWQRLRNGNLLLTESNAGRVVEVTPGGRTVWEWVAEPYDDSSVPVVTEGTRYPMTREQVAGWPCSPDSSLGRKERSTP